jgi:DNA-binding NarL/FixJ family response regulator
MNIPLSRKDQPTLMDGASHMILANVVVIHPMPVVRRGVSGLLSDSHICEASAISTFESLAQAAPMLSTLRSGDVLIMGAEEASTLARETLPKGVGVAALGSCDSTAQKAFEAGRIDATLPTTSSSEDIVRAVVLLASGGRALHKRTHQQRLGGGIGRLSQRQFEILELMTRGLLNKQIAWELGLTEGTVKSHVSAILEKLGCSRRTQAITAFMLSGAREFAANKG